jgi:hypothetical protein
MPYPVNGYAEYSGWLLEINGWRILSCQAANEKMECFWVDNRYVGFLVMGCSRPRLGIQPGLRARGT